MSMLNIHNNNYDQREKQSRRPEALPHRPGSDSYESGALCHDSQLDLRLRKAIVSASDRPLCVCVCTRARGRVCVCVPARSVTLHINYLLTFTSCML